MQATPNDGQAHTVQVHSDITAGVSSIVDRRSSTDTHHGLGIELLSENRENSWTLNTAIDSDDDVFYYHLALTNPMRFNEIGLQAEDAEVFYAMQMVSPLLLSAGQINRTL